MVASLGRMRRGPAALAVLAAGATNLPIVRNFFTADDFEHLVDLANFGPGPFILQPRAGHMYLVRNSIFTLHVLAFGMHPAGYFMFALATHILNVVMLFVLARRLTGIAETACLAAVLFGVSPSNPGTLGWYSVYGHALATAWTLGALLLIVPADAESPPPGLVRALGVAGCMLAASQSFGTGAAVALVLPIIVALLRGSTFRVPPAAAAVCSVPVIVLGAMWAMYSVRTNFNPDPDRVIGAMVTAGTFHRAIAAMIGHILSLGIVGLVLGGAYPMTRYPDWISSVTVVGWAVGVSWAFVVAPRPIRRALLAFLTVALACYAAIAEGRAALYAGLVRPDALAQAYAASSRFQYLAQAALAIVTCLVLREASRSLTDHARLVRASITGWLAAAIVGGAVTAIHIDHHDGDRTAFTRAHDRIATELRGTPPGTVACLPNLPAIPFPGFPGDVGLFMLEHRTDEMEGRRVFFVSPDGAVPPRDRGGRLDRLLRKSDDCPPHGAREERGDRTSSLSHPVCSREAGRGPGTRHVERWSHAPIPTVDRETAIGRCAIRAGAPSLPPPCARVIAGRPARRSARLAPGPHASPRPTPGSARAARRPRHRGRTRRTSPPSPA